MNKYPPKILIIGGHDPTGGAGIQADIETLTNLNCHAVCLISCLRVSKCFGVGSNITKASILSFSFLINFSIES